MTRPPLTPEAFDALIARSGLTLSPDRRDRLLAVRGIIDDVVALIWRDLPREAEPAHVFVAATARVETPA